VKWGSEAQRERYLPRLASGVWIAASAWSESGSGAEKRNLATKARRTEGGGWLLEGAKAFTTGAGLADVYLVLAQTSAPTDGVASTYGSDGQTFFLIEAGNPGLFVNTGMDLVGMRSSATAPTRPCATSPGSPPRGRPTCSGWVAARAGSRSVPVGGVEGAGGAGQPALLPPRRHRPAQSGHRLHLAEGHAPAADHGVHPGVLDVPGPHPGRPGPCGLPA
jgi:hypothetical protein